VPPETPAGLAIETADTPGLRRWLRLPWDAVATLIGLLYWVILGPLLTLTSAILLLVLPRRGGGVVGRFLIHHLFRGFAGYVRMTGLVRADTRALERIARDERPLIIAPNHLALWDAVFIIARAGRAVCVMKKSILRNPVLGGGAMLAAYIPNDGMTRMIRAAVRSLEAGGQLLLFPEGTRTRPDARWINPLKGGCAIIASRAKVPVVPVFIRSNSRFLEKGWPPWRMPVFPIRIRIDVGEPLVFGEGESVQHFTRRLEAVFETELARTDPLRRNAGGHQVRRTAE
jgi:1-acyl-sn-glycerol-3-phosphate acyltransferase